MCPTAGIAHTPMGKVEKLSKALPSFREGALQGYVFALIAVSIAASLRAALGPNISHAIYLPYWPAVLAAALVGGFRAGLLSVGLSALAAAYWQLPPEGVMVNPWQDRFGPAVFIVVAVAVVCLAGAYREVSRELERRVTEQKRAEEALRESEQQWKAVFEHNPTMYFMVDTAGTILSVNLLGAEHLGYKAEELTGRPVQNLFHDADREAAQRHIFLCLAQPRHAMSWELRKVRKNGSIVMYDSAYDEVGRYNWYNGWPSGLQMGVVITSHQRGAPFADGQNA